MRLSRTDGGALMHLMLCPPIHPSPGTAGAYRQAKPMAGGW